MVANMTAAIESDSSRVELERSATMIAPTRITPWMAFAPLISGVCKVDETFETTSKPTKTANTNIEMIAICSIYFTIPSRIAPPWVSADAAMISSLKSGVATPSLTIKRRRLTTFREYKEEAWKGS